ncbi:MAG: hypothetical protein GDA48_15720 [Hormoscilla sp. GM102CHS1]|nr:hypothetical protein [Hormoscilla sp. GM102CHS1]
MWDEELKVEEKYDEIVTISPFGFKFFSNIEGVLGKLTEDGKITTDRRKCEQSNMGRGIWKTKEKDYNRNDSRDNRKTRDRGS